MAAGSFSATTLTKINLKSEQMWSDNSYKNGKNVNSVAAQAVLANQQVKIKYLTDTDKDRQVKISWLKSCDLPVEDCTANCTIGGTEIESAAKDVAITICKHVDFTINASKLRDNEYNFEEVAAEGMNTAKKMLDEYIAQQTLVKLHGFEGGNAYAAPWTYAAGVTTIPAADYNLNALLRIQYQAQMNNLANPYFINGGDNGELWLAYQQALLNSKNLDGAGDAARTQLLKMYFDQFNFVKSGTTENIFGVAQNAVAIVSKAYNPDTVTLVAGSNIYQQRWTTPSLTLPGIKYDVFYSLECDDTSPVFAKGDLVHKWRFEVNFDVLLNPEGCPVTVGGTTYTQTGVLAWKKGA